MKYLVLGREPYIYLDKIYCKKLHTIRYIYILQGNEVNKLTLLNNKIVDYVNLLLRKRDYEGCTLDQVIELRLQMGQLVYSLVEEEGTDSTARVPKLFFANVQKYISKKLICHDLHIYCTGFCYMLITTKTTQERLHVASKWVLHIWHHTEWGAISHRMGLPDLVKNALKQTMSVIFCVHFIVWLYKAFSLNAVLKSCPKVTAMNL